LSVVSAKSSDGVVDGLDFLSTVVWNRNVLLKAPSFGEILSVLG